MIKSMMQHNEFLQFEYKLLRLIEGQEGRYWLIAEINIQIFCSHLIEGCLVTLTLHKLILWSVSAFLYFD